MIVRTVILFAVIFNNKPEIFCDLGHLEVSFSNILKGIGDLGFFMKMAKGQTSINIHEQELVLLPAGAVYFPAWNSLLVADLHLGKAAHFRKNGIPVPPQADEANWFQLASVLDNHPGADLIFLGDLFHSDYNPDWDNMAELKGHYRDHRFILVRGNHDILDGEHYGETGIEVCETMDLGPFLLTHHPLEEVPSGKYNLAGHIHPGVRLKGRGRQRIAVPCFYFDVKNGILPAFGAFKGKHLLEPGKGSRVFVITGDAVIDASANF